jgi:hypothetical protein
MASKKPQQSLADYVTIALSPLLIMALIGSLVFFLLEILYAGQYPERLRSTLFWFVFGMVLIARISIELGTERATLYCLGLGGAVFLALQAFIQYAPGSPLAAFGWAINLGLIVLICWCAYKLTWDCTFIDDNVDASGQGVLQAAGLDEPAADGAAEQPPQSTPADADLDPAKEKPGLIGWWDRYRRYKAEQHRKPHTPGVWVVYFSLAALPLFGLGQSLIPADDRERRQKVFWLMVCYVGSGLGLLVTTSFLGLRRYLRQRKLKMPAAMTGVWLALGGGLIAVFLLLGALLPRPYGEYQFTDITPLGSKDRSASQYAVNRDDAGKGEGRASSNPEKEDPEAKGGSGAKAGDEGQSKSGSKSQGGNSGKSGSGSGQRGNQRGGRSQGKSGQSSSKGEGRSDNQDQKTDQKADDGKDDQSRDQDDRKAEDSQDEQKKDQTGSKSSSSSSSQRKSAPSRTGGSRSSSSSPILGFMSKLGWVGTVLKWIVFGVLVLLVVFYVLRSGLRFLANFTQWARRLLDALAAWWAGLFGGGKDETAPGDEAEKQVPVKQPRPFSSFHNPFLDGSAEQRSPDELARYTFEALQAWAWERDLGRQPEETPLEFAARLGSELPALEAGARRVVGLYARTAYGRGRLPAGCLGVLKEFWEQLETVSERPLSA